MRLAIVGTGISGLVCAHLLHDEHELTIYEAGDHVGGHTVTTGVRCDGRTYRVDAGFIVYNEVNYPNFVRLLARLGVETQPTSMSFSVRDDRAGLEYCGTSLNTLFAQRRNLLRPSFLRLLGDIRRFNSEARALLAAGGVQPTLRQFLEAGGYKRQLVDQYLVPMGAAIWSTRPAQMLDFPAEFFLRFLDNHGLLSARGHFTWRVVRGGSQRYVEALVAPFRDRIRLRTPVRRVERSAQAVEISPATASAAASTRSSWPPTAIRRCACWRRPAPPSARSWAPFPTRPTAPTCTPTSRCCRATGGRGRAGTTSGRPTATAGWR